MVEEVKHFMCFKHELERINEGLILRGTDASSVINITDNGDEVVVWYKFKNKQDMKQTAVEWLELNLLGLISFDSEELRVKYKERVAKAKEMEKEQIIDARLTLRKSGVSYKEEAKQYYNEQFKNK